ncbi:MAG: GMC family oxidoreductase N-terminal domain-containing protein [Candidatus Competibacteraceae bacterium]
MTRRTFGKLCAKLAIGFSAYLAGCANIFKLKDTNTAAITQDDGPVTDEYEYIVVGSGAGGGPLAANLARKGHSVLLLEAGGDNEDDNYRVPLFHVLASEDPALRWDFFVRHYQNEEQSHKDSKFSDRYDGVFYPRCGTLGGCTAHNAMILVYPHNSDWDYIATVTGDPSWHSDNMRHYFERLENCQYLNRPDDPANNPSRHGFGGWLPTSLPPAGTVLSVIKDRQLRYMTLKSVVTALKKSVGSPLSLLKTQFDPNDWRNATVSVEGMCRMPLTTHGGRRAGTREYIRQVERANGGRLKVKLHALVTRVLLDENNTAIGVEYLQGRRLYRADRTPPAEAATAEKKQVRATREVILSGGAFNTPQLLMLSGIGPKEELERHGIAVRVNLPGVGENLQDRYEISVITEMKDSFSLLQDVTFTAPQPGEQPDRFYLDWQKGTGIYTTNGVVLSCIKRSLPERPEPDLFIFGMPGYFEGYFPGYSKRVTQDQNYFTWAILKAHTRNTAGVIRLKSNDPRDVPYINFHYFDEGNDKANEDLQSLVEGIKFVREITAGADRVIKKEAIPGDHIKTQVQLDEFVKANAWGHHASCSCKMGNKNDKMAVVDSRFQVYGTQGLRVVDASVFPRIPGFFIVSAIYMISEKASDIIHKEAGAAIQANRDSGKQA